MATDVKQNLSLGKLRRAVDGNNFLYKYRVCLK